MPRGRGADGPKEENGGPSDAQGGGGMRGLTGRGREATMLVMPLSEEACETLFPARKACLVRARARAPACRACSLPPRSVARPWVQPLKIFMYICIYGNPPWTYLFLFGCLPASTWPSSSQGLGLRIRPAFRNSLFSYVFLQAAFQKTLVLQMLPESVLAKNMGCTDAF